MKKILGLFVFAIFLSFFSSASDAAYVSRFDAIRYIPTTDGGHFFTVYGSETLNAFQGHLGASFDYANQPLRFSGTGSFLGTRQSVIDHMITMHALGALGFTDWFQVGLRIPIVLYNWFYSDEPVAAPSATPDPSAMPGDIEFMLKFRILDIEKYGVGLAFIPRVTAPTGDVVRYTGNGNITGGGTLAVDFKPIDQVRIGLNAGTILRDSVVRHGVEMDHQAVGGAAVSWQFHPRWEVIAEGFGTTTFANLGTTANTTLETGAGVRYLFGDSGFALDVGGTLGWIDGVGNPRYRGFTTLRWTSPAEKKVPPPDPRIQGNKIVLWGKIFYDTAKATILPISYPVLDDVVDVLVKNQNIMLVEVQGHCDHRGADDYNLKLSQARAESAMNYLISKGIESQRLRAVGYGESRPIATNETKEGMSQNRRTEFIIVQSSDGSITDLAAPQGVNPVVNP